MQFFVQFSRKYGHRINIAEYRFAANPALKTYKNENTEQKIVKFSDILSTHFGGSDLKVWRQEALDQTMSGHMPTVRNFDIGVKHHTSPQGQTTYGANGIDLFTLGLG